MTDYPTRPLRAGEWIRLFLVALIIGPLLGTMLFLFSSAITEGSEISSYILFSPALLYASLYAVPSALVAAGMLAWVRSRGALVLWKVVLCGLIGGFVPFFLLITILDGFTSGFLSGLIGAVLGAIVACLLWLLRHVFGLSAL